MGVQGVVSFKTGDGAPSAVPGLNAGSMSGQPSPVFFRIRFELTFVKECVGEGFNWDDIPPGLRKQFVERMRDAKAAEARRSWEKEAYNKQLPPDHPRHIMQDPKTGLQCCDHLLPNWETWLLMTGRGYGKTRSGANWVLSSALKEAGIEAAVCAPTFRDVQATCFEGPSGIIKIAQPGDIIDYNKNGLRITLRNGSIIRGFSADRAESIRGANLAACWFDELGTIRYPDFYTFGLLPALRISKARLLVTTTPRRNGIIRDLLKEAEEDPERVHFTNAQTLENWKSPSVARMVEKVKRQFGLDSFLGRQELLGQFIDEVPGALFTQEYFDQTRVHRQDVPPLRYTVVAVDPASSSSHRSDEYGIVVLGEGIDREFYVLEDASLSASTEKVMARIVHMYHAWDADIVVVEKNVAGDWFRDALYRVDPHANYKPVHAMKGKVIRAQPVSSIAARGLIHFVGNAGDFETLESQLYAMTAFDDRVKAHDDRADAFVWGMRELAGMSAVDWNEVYGFEPCKACGADTNVLVDKICKACATPIVREVKKDTFNREKAAIRWANAYFRTCEKGHEYPLKSGRCPECHGDPNVYLAQIAAFSGSVNGGWHNYAGKAWLAGRKI